MELQQIKEKLLQEEYNFSREDTYLGKNIILLGLGGSHAYGTSNENSDVDIRGIALNPKTDILLGKDFGEVVNVETDTTIYSVNKMIDLLTKCNPNTIEILGLLPEHYLFCTDIGQELLDKRKMFLSKICVHTFGNYANSQLRIMENKAAREAGQKKTRRKYFEKHSECKI